MSQLRLRQAAKNLNDRVKRQSEPRRQVVSGYVSSVTGNSQSQARYANVQLSSGMGMSQAVSVPYPAGSGIYAGQTVAVVNNGSPSMASWQIVGAPSAPAGYAGGQIIGPDGYSVGAFSQVWITEGGLILIGGQLGENGVTGEHGWIDQHSIRLYDEQGRLTVGLFGSDVLDKDGETWWQSGDGLLGHVEDDGGNLFVDGEDGSLHLRRGTTTVVRFGGAYDARILDWLNVGPASGPQVGLGVLEIDGVEESAIVVRDKDNRVKAVLRSDSGHDDAYLHIGRDVALGHYLRYTWEGVKVSGNIEVIDGRIIGPMLADENGYLLLPDPTAGSDAQALLTPRYLEGRGPAGDRTVLIAWGASTLPIDPRDGDLGYRTWLGGEVYFGDWQARHFRVERGDGARAGMFYGDTGRVWMDVDGYMHASGGYLEDLSISGTLTIAAGGKITVSDETFLDENGLKLALSATDPADEWNTIAWVDRTTLDYVVADIAGVENGTERFLRIKVDGNTDSGPEFAGSIYLQAVGGTSEDGLIYFSVKGDGASGLALFRLQTDGTDSEFYVYADVIDLSGAVEVSSLAIPDEGGGSGKLWLGTANDAAIYYNGTNLVLNPREVGTGGLIVQGSLLYQLTTKTADYTATALNDVILADATSGNVVITLPPVSGNTGVHYTIKRIDGSANTVTVDGDGSETIDGETTQTLLEHDSITVICDGTEWWII